MWFQKNKWKIIVPVLIVAVLAAAFYFGGNAPDSKGWEVSSNESAVSATPDVEPTDVSAPEKTTDTDKDQESTTNTTKQPDNTSNPAPDVTPSSPENIAAPEETPEQPPEQTTPPEETQTPEVSQMPAPEESTPPSEEPDDGILTCTIYIQCETILNNMELCDPNKVDIVPANGWILGNTEVTFTEGETVFDVLQRVCKEKGIHMEYMESPIYNSAYIEGIYNLYEFDVGNLSGWMYKVNGWFPNYGCSLYTLSDGDIIGWVYTCDLGNDVGGGYSTGG